MSEVKFYMNSPCVVIRKIDKQFSEVRLNPKFAHSMDGSEFCQGCMLGPMDGAHPSHSCEEYNLIIESVNDQAAAVVVVVENRLLHAEPIEAVKYGKLEERVRTAKSALNELANISTEERLNAAAYIDEFKRVEAKISQSKSSLESADAEYEQARDRLQTVRDEYAKSIELKSGNVSLGGEELKQLYRDSYILNELVNGGVDNWSFYDEARPSVEDVEQYASSMVSQ